MMTTIVMATDTLLRPREKADAFLSQLEVGSRPVKPTKVVTEPTEKSTPVLPEKIKVIPLSDYWKDAQQRWKIHQKEIWNLKHDIEQLIDWIKSLRNENEKD